MSGKSLKKFTKNLSVTSTGELTVNAGRYSRAAIIMAFELNGGIGSFAEWADENKSEFYTKLFGKLVGREAEATKSDEVEDLLDILDGECEDVTDIDAIEAPDDADTIPTADFFEPTEQERRLARAALRYADAEPID